MAHILIVGQGLSGITAALQLNKLIAEDDWMTVVSPERHAIIKTALPEVSLGLRSIDEARIEIEPLMARNHIGYIQADIEALHPERQIVVLKGGQRVPFDYLVIADGMEPAYDHITGFTRSHDTVHSLASTDETIRAEVGFQDFLNSPGPITVACAPGSIEYQNAYQYVFHLDRLLRQYRIRNKVPIQFITSEPFLGHFGIGGIGDSKKLFEGAFRSRQVQWVCNAAIDRIEGQAIHVVHFDDEGLQKGRKLLETRYGILWPAMRAHRFIKEVEGLTNGMGLMPTNRFLQSYRYHNIFAIGEIVASLPLDPTPMETPQPCSDFLRESMTSAVAGNLAEIIRHRYPLYEPTGNGFFMVDYGGRGAAFFAVPQRPPRNFDKIIEGRLVHVVKRASERYHFRKLRAGVTEPIFERLIFRLIKMPRIKQKVA